MVTGEEFCRKSFEKNKIHGDYQSYKNGWYDRERWSYEDNSHVSIIVKRVNKKLDQINEYLFTLYEDLQIEDKYMGHEDPHANIQCLLNQIRNEARELADRRAGEQFLLF